jgi:predicted ATPase/DNA-binding winged helix-turn-helix (wHTH) protein
VQQRPEIALFGPYELKIAERSLEKDGVPVELGGRLFDVLVTLIEQAGKVVEKRELLDAVWKDVTVEEASLRVAISMLRKTLGDGVAGARYIANVPGRGYSFVAPVKFSGHTNSNLGSSGVSEERRLPNRPLHIVGRDDEIAALSGKLLARRFLSVIGPGGIGKTTVAVSIAHSLSEEFQGRVFFVDLSPLQAPEVVVGVLASTLGVVVRSAEDPLQSLIAYLRSERLLLILDSCEHLIDTMAELAERIFLETDHVCILATSREPLRAEGEFVYRLPALEAPHSAANLSVAEALNFPAVQLFVLRATARSTGFAMTDENAPSVAEICRRLDGIALAIELAAGRVEAYGVEGTAALLDRRFELSWSGRRTAPARHQTLTATLDWSYGLLSETERVLLRRLAIFVGLFSLEAVIALNGDEPTSDDLSLINDMASLVLKSLVSVETDGDTVRYRLLDTTRAYLWDKRTESGEADTLSRRHALYYCRLLHTEDEAMSAGMVVKGRAAYVELLGNTRAALGWCFSPQGDPEIGAALAAVAGPVFIRLSLLAECLRWSERALGTLSASQRGTRSEMLLTGSLGHSLMFTKASLEEVFEAFTRSLAIAETLGLYHHQVHLFVLRHMYLSRRADFIRARECAMRSITAAEATNDTACISVASSLVGVAHHYSGDYLEARRHLEVALGKARLAKRVDPARFGFDCINRAQVALASTLWMLGYADQAQSMANQAVAEAESLAHPITLCIALAWSIILFLRMRNLVPAARNVERLLALAKQHSMPPYHAFGLGLQGELVVRSGDAHKALPILQESLGQLTSQHYLMHATSVRLALSEALASCGQVAEALTMVDEGLLRMEQTGEFLQWPELLRVKGEILVLAEDSKAAEGCFAASLETARAQSGLSWQLRSAISMAELYRGQGRPDDGRKLLAPIFHRFTEGFEVHDLQRARMLLADLG